MPAMKRRTRSSAKVAGPLPDKHAHKDRADRDDGTKHVRPNTREHTVGAVPTPSACRVRNGGCFYPLENVEVAFVAMHCPGLHGLVATLVDMMRPSTGMMSTALYLVVPEPLWPSVALRRKRALPAPTDSPPRSPLLAATLSDMGDTDNGTPARARSGDTVGVEAAPHARATRMDASDGAREDTSTNPMVAMMAFGPCCTRRRPFVGHVGDDADGQDPTELDRQLQNAQDVGSIVAKECSQGEPPDAARLTIELCAGTSMASIMQLAMHMVNNIVGGAASMARSGTLCQSMEDYGVYKKPGFDRMFDIVRTLPNMADITVVGAARYGSARTPRRPDEPSVHPTKMYNTRVVDVVPKSEGTRAGRAQDLIATHRGTRWRVTPDGEWVRLRVVLTEDDARRYAGRVAGALRGLARMAATLGTLPTSIPPPCSICWIRLDALAPQ